MKTRTKTLAVVEIVIVLCSVFLMALPTIAADQTAQKGSATASEVTTASEDDFTLGIYGNANEDDTIDMRDTTYIKLAIFGKKPKTDLSDANNDGKVSMLDVGQTKLIILRKEKELVLQDDTERVVTVYEPIERFIYNGHNRYIVEALRAIGVADKIVGVGHSFKSEGVLFPKLSKLPDIGGWDPDYEVIVDLKPDVFITDPLWFARFPNVAEKLPGIPVIVMDVQMMSIKENIRKYAYLLDAKKEADEYINWYNDWRDKIQERVEGLSEDEKPRVLFTFYTTPGTNSFPILAKDRPRPDIVRKAGAKYLGDEFDISYITQSSVKVDPEWIIEQNPDIVVLAIYGADKVGYNVDDPSQAAALREDFLNRPEFAEVNAVKNKKVYMIASSDLLIGGPSGLLGLAYYVRWFHPSLSEDIDPQAMHQEYIDSFCPGLDFDVSEHGVFVYPPIE